MKQIVCPLCDSPDWVGAAEAHDRLTGVAGRFRIVQCSQCELHYLNPQPTLEELVPFYGESYDPFTTPPPAELPWLQRVSVNYGLRKRCRAVTRFKQEGRLLEVGCANGLFLDAMRRRGNWQLQGIDTSEHAARYARERLGLDVFHGTLEEAHLPSDSFDVVVMWDVLEHVHRPRDTLHEIRRVLKADGLLILRLPVLDAWGHALFGPYWAGWDTPRHLTTFSTLTLRTLLARTGFRVENTAHISGSYATFVLSTRFWAGEHLPTGAQTWVRRLLDSMLARLLTAPAFWVADRLGKSSVPTVYAKPALNVD